MRRRQRGLVLRLYVAGSGPHSATALANPRAILDGLSDGSVHELEVVDVFEHVERAEADEILVTPTLLKLTPSPPARIVGTLNDAPLVRKVLGLSEATT